MTANRIELQVDKHHQRIRKILRKHKSLWTRDVGDSKTIQHNTDLIPGARPFKSATCCAGPKTRELEQLEIYKQLKDGVIDRSNSK